MPGRVFVVGVGMTPFVKPGGPKDYTDLTKDAVTDALKDAGIPYHYIQQAVSGHVYGDSTSAQRALYTVGLSGIPIMGVNNNCSTGSSALFLAKQLIEGGVVDCALAFGFEKMEKGSLGSKFMDRTNPLDQHMATLAEIKGISAVPPAPQLFGSAGKEHMEKYGTKLEHFAKIAAKNHKHSVNNPRSQFRAGYTLEQVMKSPKVYEPLTKLQCCPTSDGAGAAILVSEKFVHQYGLYDKAVEIIGMAMKTDYRSSFENSMIKCVGFDMTKDAANEAYKQAKITPNDVQVIELHDCFSANELITYEGLGLCKEGEAAKIVDNNDNTYGGKWVVNPSGGLISKGHPLGATGLAQCFELCSQLRGECGVRQVPNAKIALQHNLGLGGAAVVTIYKKASFDKKNPKPQSFVAKPAIDISPITPKAGVPFSAPAEQPAPKAKKGGAAAAPAAAGSFKATALFEGLKQRVAAEPETAKKINCSYRFDVTSGDQTKSWLVDLKSSPASIKESDASASADCIVALSDETFVALMSGKAQAQSLFMKGQIKLRGNMMLAMKLDGLIKPAAKL